jgi:phospholipase C
VPALIISPHARRGYVDHTLYDTTSILALIEWRWGLVPLGERDARASNLTAAFDFPGPGSLGSLDVSAVFGSAGAALLVAALGLAAWQAFDTRGSRGRR